MELSEEQKEKLQQLALNVKAGCLLDSQYNPENEIFEFIEQLPKADVVITAVDNKINIHSNHPEVFGTVMLYHDAADFNSQTMGVVKLKDDANAWHKALYDNHPREEINPYYNLAKFLADFILSNT